MNNIVLIYNGIDWNEHIIVEFDFTCTSTYVLCI